MDDPLGDLESVAKKLKRTAKRRHKQFEKDLPVYLATRPSSPTTR